MGSPKLNYFSPSPAFRHNNIVLLCRSKDYKKGEDDKNKHGFLEEYVLPLANQHMVSNYSYSVTPAFVFLKCGWNK